MLTRILIIAFPLVVLVVPSPSPGVIAGSPKFATRCGWYDNPTPGNYSLYDREREWIIGVQGGYEVGRFRRAPFR